jgi:hypothetical protein
MSDRLGIWARTAVWALPVYGALLAIGTVTQQPDYRTDFGAYASYVTMATFLASHVIASIVGAAFGLIGMAALFVLTDDASPKRARSGFVLSAFGQVGLVSIFGVAAFAQPAIGRAFLDGGRTVAEAINADVYGGALVAIAALSLVLFVGGGVLLGSAARRVRTWPRWAGTAFAGRSRCSRSGCSSRCRFSNRLRGSASAWRASGSPGRPELRIVPQPSWSRTG